MKRLFAAAVAVSALALVSGAEAKNRPVNLTVKPKTSYLKTPAAPLPGTVSRLDVDGRAGSVTLEGHAVALPTSVTTSFPPQRNGIIRFPL